MTDTEEERVEDEYTEIPSREDFQRWTEEYLHFSGEGISDYYPDMGSYLHDQLVRWRHGRRLGARQREEGMIDALGGTEPTPPEARQAFGKLLGQASTPQREGGREPVAWEERLAAALASALASAELVRRRGNGPNWWRCVACWEEGRGPGRIEHEPDCPEAVYGAWKADTEPPAEQERDEALQRAFREHETTIRAMSEHLCDATRLSLGGMRWICTRPPEHEGRHAWRPKPRPAEPPADTVEGAGGDDGDRAPE